MDWLLLALISAAGFGVSSFIDKLAITKFVKSQWTYYWWWIVYSALLGPLFLLLSRQPEFNGLALVSGLISALTGRAYLSAIGKEDVSNVLALVFISPIFVMALSVLFMGDTLSGQDYAGVFVLVIGACLMGLREPRRLTFTKGARLAILAAILASVSTLFYKAATGMSDPYVCIAWDWIGWGIMGTIVGWGHFKDFRREFPRLGAKRIGVLVFMMLVVIVAFLALTDAYALQSAALVSAVSASQPLFVFLYVLAASIFIPKILKEEVGAKAVLFKLLGGLLIIIGVYLVS